MKTYRHTVTHSHGDFRMDSTVQYPLAVVYCGWKNMPEATKRRLEEKEGVLYGWCRDERHSVQLYNEALAEGCLNIFIVTVNIRELS